MTKPTIHLNGTSAESLLEALNKACTAIRSARNALGEAAPNARDYYPQGDAAFPAAVREHRARDLALKTVFDELVEIAEHVLDAQESRR
jgi:hypothetical protein